MDKEGKSNFHPWHYFLTGLVIALSFSLIGFKCLNTEAPLSNEESTTLGNNYKEPFDSIQSAISFIAKSNQAFTSNILPYMIKANGNDKNLVTSIPSLTTVLGMLYVGAGGETARQLSNGTRDDDIFYRGYQNLMTMLSSNENFTLEAANRIYVQKDFDVEEEFLHKTGKYFLSSAETIDFTQGEEARHTINQWVQAQTMGKIKDPIQFIDSNTVMILVNAVYFKSDWVEKFKETQTSKKDFHLDSDKTIMVDMMHMTSYFYWTHDNDMGCTILSLPYKGERLEMLLFLSDSLDSFTEMEKKFASFDFAGLYLNRREEFHISIPKFKLETSHKLKQPLVNIGLSYMFTSVTADFSNMSKQSKLSKLHVSDVMQKAFIEVNEGGTEAAAATVAVVWGHSSLVSRNPIKQFNCNRPFLFAIRDNLSMQVLFSGRVINPKEN